VLPAQVLVKGPDAVMSTRTTMLLIFWAMASIFRPTRSVIVATAAIAVMIVTTAIVAISVTVAASDIDGATAVVTAVISAGAVCTAFFNTARQCKTCEADDSGHKQRFYEHENSSYTGK
ncbi:MAG: hypothetical protein KGI75_16315, partial [Rhizobiaceae bacterium]|nr:hypothetical protein [Rhizobiaceae bacterium]